VIEWAGRRNRSFGDQAPSSEVTLTASGLPGMLTSPRAAPWMRQAAAAATGLAASFSFSDTGWRGE